MSRPQKKQTPEAVAAAWCTEAYAQHKETVKQQRDLLRLFKLMAAAEATGMTVQKSVDPSRQFPIQVKFLYWGEDLPKTLVFGDYQSDWLYYAIEADVEAWNKREARARYLDSLRQKLESSLSHDEKVALGLRQDNN